MTAITEIAQAADSFIEDNWQDSMVLTIAEMLDEDATLYVHEWKVEIVADWEVARFQTHTDPAEMRCHGWYQVTDHYGKVVDSGTFGTDGPENLSIAYLVR
jgi:hypothetical protein